MSNKISCGKCDGKCCRYIAMEIDEPETKKDFEDIRWFVAHKNVNVYIDEEGEWHLEFLTPCEFLGEENKCKIYDKRPEICKEYKHNECTFHNDYSEKINFSSIDEFDNYMKGKFS